MGEAKHTTPTNRKRMQPLFRHDYITKLSICWVIYQLSQTAQSQTLSKVKKLKIPETVIGRISFLGLT